MTPRSIVLAATFVCFLPFLTACTQSSAIITGRTYLATLPDSVRVYLQAPAGKYDEIGLVSATSKNRGGFTDQGKQNAAIRILKEKAAELGANGVILRSNDISSGGTGVGVVGATPVVIAGERLAAVSGVAIRTQ